MTFTLYIILLRYDKCYKIKLSILLTKSMSLKTYLVKHSSSKLNRIIFVSNFSISK